MVKQQCNYATCITELFPFSKLLLFICLNVSLTPKGRPCQTEKLRISSDALVHFYDFRNIQRLFPYIAFTEGLSNRNSVL